MFVFREKHFKEYSQDWSIHVLLNNLIKPQQPQFWPKQKPNLSDAGHVITFITMLDYSATRIPSSSITGGPLEGFTPSDYVHTAYEIESAAKPKINLYNYQNF